MANQYLQKLNIEFLENILSLASSRVSIASAFSKSDVFERLCLSTTLKGPKVLISRWQFNDLVSGASDINVYDVANNFGWDFYINQKLHAKVYHIDNDIFTGSSNLTKNGLAGGLPGNIEFNVQAVATAEIDTWFDDLLNSSIKVDHTIYDAIEMDIRDYKQVAGDNYTSRKGFSKRVTDLLCARQPVKSLFIHDLPLSSDPFHLLDENRDKDDSVCHDKRVLGLPDNPTIEQIRTSFQISPGYIWLIKTVSGQMFYGQISEKLHNDLCDEPKPYRLEVKECLSNLLSWASRLFPDTIVIDRPNYSQRVRIIAG